jgi:folate-binding protein YgfZ
MQHGTNVPDPKHAWNAAATAAVVADAQQGLLTFDGADAGAFLQGQLSTDVLSLAPGQGSWTTYNSPKGRLLATPYLIRDAAGERYWAALPAALAAPVAKRLAMFVLRAKVTVMDASAAYRVLGIGGPAAGQAAEATFGVTPDAGRMALSDEVRMLRLPDGRLFVFAPSEIADSVFDRLARYATPVDAGVWAWLGVQSGVPTITPATQDLFVAQAANFDALGAIDFRKGCYTGQEIVARMQYLGRLKERLFTFSTTAAAPPPGTRLFGSAHGDQASGTVVNSAPDPEGGSRFLAVAHIEAANAGTMTIGAVDGPVARREALPYAVPEPQPPRGRVQL